MKVLYTCDDNYIWIMGISMISLFENNKEMDFIEVYLLGDNISDENKNIINTIGDKYSRQVIVIDMPKFDIPESIVSARWPLAAFSRLFSGELLPNNIDRILYLDCDTIVCGDLSELATWDMQGKTFCGVKDCIGAAYKKNIGMPEDMPYINAGVILMDLVNMRQINMREAINNYMTKYEKLISYADQDILNGVFYDEIGYINPSYDVMTIDVAHTYDEIRLLRKPTGFYNREDMNAAIKNIRIIHYTTNMLVIRPWYKNSDHPLKDKFYQYMSISPWSDRKLVDMRFNRIDKAIGIIQVLPNYLAYRLLGFIHSELKPRYVKMRVK